MNNQPTIEAKTAEALLQKPFCVMIDGQEHEVATPTTATLIATSALISQMELRRPEDDPELSILAFVMRSAKDLQAIADVVSILITGEQPQPRSLFEWIRNRRLNRRREELRRAILYRTTPEELQRILLQLFERIGVADFFAITTFLSEMNISKGTRGVATTETEAIAPGL